MDWRTEYYTHPDCEIREEHGWGLDVSPHPRSWAYWQHGIMEERLMDRRQMVSTILGILATAITICVISYLLYENSTTSWATIQENCSEVVDSGQSELVIAQTCDYYK